MDFIQFMRAMKQLVSGSVTARSSETFRHFLVFVLFLLALVICSVFWGFQYRASSLICEQTVDQARAFFQEIVLTRKWVASHGGVYVELRPGMVVNPYLQKIPGVRSVIRDQEGRVYTLKNPALVTRELSELASRDGLFSFKITSLKPVNPQNSPDPFERSALQAFEKGKVELFSFHEAKGHTFLRYMAPLKTTKDCLFCHASQGYRVGDIRGGISVTLPADEVMTQITANRIILVVAALAILLLAGGIVVNVSLYYMKRLDQAENLLLDNATRDFLTGILNRREGLRRMAEEMDKHERQQSPLSVALFDLDNFKLVNDSMGHAAGDAVLKKFAILVTGFARSYDISCRYGGEEFLLVLPGTAIDCAVEMCERLRRTVEQTVVIWETKPVGIRISAGVVMVRPGEKVDSLLQRADTALYAAKEGGRNRVCALV